MNKRLQHFKNRYEELKNARADFEPDWKQLNKFLAPSTGMLYTDPANDKDKRRYTYPKDNLNGLPQRYMRNLSTALVATLCPPDSRWFGYSVPNMTDEEQSWLHKASDRVMAIFQARGISSYLEALFYEGAVYGLSCMSMEKSNKYKLDFGNFTIGEFYLDDDFEGNENTLYHRFAMNTRQLKEWFGYERLPQRLRDELDSGKKFTTWNVIQAIEPNPDYLPEFKNEFNKAYVSYIWLEGLNADDCVIEEKGMRDFPFIVFHWYRKINTPYTMGLGHDVLPDVKELQALERDTKRARAKKINPPLRADPSLKNAGVKVGSDDINWTNNKEGVTPLYNVNFDTQEGQAAIQDKEQKLYQLTYNYLFSQIINRNKTMSATEVNKVSQEELILLGGIVQNATMALGAVCERAFKLLYEQGELPENMPESLRGKIMNTTFHSLLAQSQSLSDLKLVERWLQAMSIMAQMNPNAMRKVDVFRIADEYARRLDIDTGLVVPTEEVEKQIQSEINAQREAQQQQMKADALKAMGSATKDFAEAGTIAQQIQGVM
jgi:hypothetical protein